ncbi:MAG: alpha/beta fold hydrolase [Acidobacteria bacterium]|nr:alpha/beta fold hydrolase [Acidobacteriota bacterium]
MDPQWSRYVDVISGADVDAGQSRRWHVLDNSAELAAKGLTPVGTLLCVHGNPTWSYLWRTLVAAGANPNQPWRVIAVDQLDMGFSERTGTFRRLADRIVDLHDLTTVLGVSGPVVTAGHDWGGVISLGWAVNHPQLLAGVVLTNTAVHQESSTPIPWPLRVALHPAVHGWGTTTSPAFLRVTHALARPALASDVRRAFMAPYKNPARRGGVGNFVADIPVDATHPSFASLTAVAEGIRELSVPALFLWGPGDPIFSDKYLRDLITRMPQAEVHRFEGASHMLHEDVDVAGSVFEWLGTAQLPTSDTTSAPKGLQAAAASSADSETFAPLWAELERRSTETSDAVVDMSTTSDGSSISTSKSWAELASEVSQLVRGLHAAGVQRGDRVSLLVPPGSTLTALIYACLRLGAVVVLADAGLGARGLSRAVKGAGPEFVIGINRALMAAKTFSWPGQRISVEALSPTLARTLGVRMPLDRVRELGSAAASLPAEPGPDELAAVLFTSGSTGPAKGVLYTHRQLSAMRDTLQQTYGLKSGTGLVAGFAPFALLGPALGATSVTPDMDVTAPRTLTAQALADAAAAIKATAVFVSPAAMANVLASAFAVNAAQRAALSDVDLLLSAGAPISTSLLESAAHLMPQAALHTPYGMTEALPITDIDLPEILQAASDAAAGTVAGSGNGVCVGRSVAGARVAIAPLDAQGVPVSDLTSDVAVTGEIVISASHMKDGYDRLWRTQRVSEANSGWHRTGDVGHLDALGRLWVEGRLAHVMTTASGVVTPVAAEQAAERVPTVSRAAVVAVGPTGTQAVVVVVETNPTASKSALATPELAAAVRTAVREVGVEVNAVLVVPRIPTDIRHNAKVDRAALARWASKALAGGRMSNP